MSLDVAALRSHFPSLASGIAFFDGPGGTQTPRVVGQAIAEVLTGPLSQAGRGIASAINADDAVTGFRSAYADLLGVPAAGVIYGRSATQLTYDLARALAKNWAPGDEVVVSRLDHDCNVRPWVQVAQASGVVVRWIDFDPATAEIIWDSVESAITDRTRLVAVAGASNLLGSILPVRAIAEKAHAVGAHLHVDGVHYAAHRFVDVAELGADTFVCSPYKFLGPHCAVLAGSPEMWEDVRPDKLLPASDEVPARFEHGTLPFETLAGATAAVDFLASLDSGTAEDRRDRLQGAWHAIDEQEVRQRTRIEAGLADLGDAVRLHSKAADRTPTLLATFPGRSCVDVSQFLAERDVHAPASSFYAYEPFRRLGLADSGDAAALRIGLAPYTNDDDVDRLLDGIAAFVRG